MRRLPHSIFGLAALATLILGVATIAIGTVIYLVSHEALEQQLDHRIAAESRSLVVIAGQDGVGALTAAIGQREDGHSTNGLGYALFGPSGARVAGKLDIRRPPLGWHELLPVGGAEPDDTVVQALAVVVPGRHQLVVGADRTPIDEIDRTILQLFAGAFGVLLVAGTGCAWALGFIIRRRLSKIGNTAEAIIDGDLNQRVARDSSSNEFDRLADTINRMLDRIQELMENLRQVTSDIAHDLRTPLAQQKQVLSAALKDDLDAEGYRLVISKAATAGEEILDIFAALLRISEVESYQVRDWFAPVDLTELVGRVQDAFQASAEESGHRLTSEIAPGVTVYGDRQLLTQLCANLVENALRHTPGGTHINLRLAADRDAVRLEVQDDGPGIPEHEHSRVMTRFARLEKSRATHGHGLGLSLVAAIARAHFGQVILKDAKPGLIVSVIFA